MAGDLKSKLLALYEEVNNKRIPQALLKAIPYVGDSLGELLYGGDIEQLLSEIRKENHKNQNEIIQKIDDLLAKHGEKQPYIIGLGGGNIEYVYKFDDEILWGQKNQVDETLELAGGGGLNFSSRLIAAGYKTFPLLLVGKDRAGIMLKEHLLRGIKNQGFETVADYVNADGWFVPGADTPFATVIVQSETKSRTIFSHNRGVIPEILSRHLYDQMEKIESIANGTPAVIRISHICRGKDQDLLSKADILGKFISDFQHKTRIIFNPGASQIDMGIKFWEKALQGVDLFQINFQEAKRMFAKDGLESSLSKIIEWAKNREITIIITLSKFGAVGSYKNGEDGIVFAWPLEIKNMVDPTGAGDAFSAGFAAHVYDKPESTFQDFHAAIDNGRFWSGYACTTFGGAASCPNRIELDRFKKDLKRTAFEPSEVVNQRYAEQTLRLIDKAYE